MESHISLSGAWEVPEKAGALLRFLYHTAPGRLLLRGLSGRGLSRLVGRWMDSGLSRPLIGFFLKRYEIRLSDYRKADYASFNEFFCREIRPELRAMPEDPALFPAPCDGRLSAWRIGEGTVLNVKQSRFTLDELLDGDPIADRYRDGVCLVFRLCVDNYHRYCFPDDGVKGKERFIPGQLHTVRPIALGALPVFIRNCREYTMLETAHFGAVTQIEVGALLVGKIANRPGLREFVRGEEKGRFLFGGSTVIVLLEKGRVALPEELFAQSAQGLELPVKMGQPLGRALCGPAIIQQQ